MRDERRRQKLEPAYSFMIRTRLPGGVVHAAAVAGARRDRDALRQRHAAAHHAPGVPVPRRDQDRAQGDDARRSTPTLIDTIAACGDVNRNVLASRESGRVARARRGATSGRSGCPSTCCRTRAPTTRSGSTARRSRAAAEVEPIYGPTYLPRKFKAAIAVPPRQRRGRVRATTSASSPSSRTASCAGFNVAVGGGLGATHGEPTTYPRLADVVGFLKPEQLLAVAEAVVTTQRDFGDRSEPQARAPQVHDRRPRPRLVRGRDHATRRASRSSRRGRSNSTTNGDRFGWTEGTTAAGT